MPTESGGLGWLGTGTEIETGRTGAVVRFGAVRPEDEVARGVSGSPWTGDVSEVELLLTGSSRLVPIFLFPLSLFLLQFVLVDLRLHCWWE